MAFDMYRSGPCVAIVLAHNRPVSGNQQVQKWQSRGAHLAVNRHRSGPYVAVVQAYKGLDVAVNMHIYGSQHAHTQ